MRVPFQGLPCLAKLDLATGNMALVAPAGVFGVEGSYPIYDPTGQTIIYVDKTYKTIKRFTPGGALTTVLPPTIISTIRRSHRTAPGSPTPRASPPTGARSTC